MPLPGETAPPKEGARAYETVTTRYKYYDRQATKYRLADTGLGLVAILGGVVISLAAFADSPNWVLEVSGVAVGASELFLRFFHVRNRYVGLRMIAEVHRNAMDQYNQIWEKTRDEIEALKAFENLPSKRDTEVVEWAKQTMSSSTLPRDDFPSAGPPPADQSSIG